MPKKSNPKKAAAPAKAKLQGTTVGKTANDIFAKIQAKTGMANKKIDTFRKEWLEMPKTRTKYQHLTDAPLVVGEEFLGMTNDILDFVQRKEGGGNSMVFQKIKAELKEMAKDPVGFFKKEFEKAQTAAKGLTSKVQNVIEAIQKEASQAKETAEKTKSKAGAGAKKAKR